MKKQHKQSLKFHTIYSVIISIIFLVLMILKQDITLAISIVFALFYIIGNGIIHVNSNKLTRDTVIEYILVSVIIIILIIGSIS